MIIKLRWLFTFSVIVLAYQTTFAQQELWGTMINGGKYGFGFIYKTDSIGNHITDVHDFDSINGCSPGRIMLASNGKLYGLTNSGGSGEVHVPGGPSWLYTTGGTLYEYDIITSSFKVLKNFSRYDTSLPYDQPDATDGLIESSPGVLYGQFIIGGVLPAPRGYVFNYSISTGVVSIAVALPDFTGGALNETQHNYLSGPLFKASDGFLYGAAARNSTCPVGQPDNGSIIRINPVNNSLTIVYLNPCSFANGIRYQGYFQEDNGSLYSVAGGATSVSADNPFGYGIIYQYNLSAKTVTKKYEFGGDTMGYNPTPMIKGNNGKWYGLAQGGTPYHFNSSDFPNGSGIIYAYNPLTNVVTKEYEFRYSTFTGTDVGIYPGNLLKGYNGKLYGAAQYGLFEYNTDSNKARAAARFPIYNGMPTGSGPLISVCHLPAYVPDTTRTYNLCAGTFFLRNLYSPNAKQVVWKHNNVVDASQTTDVLQFSAVDNTKAGTWVCELTNDCGTTTIPAFTIVVNSATGNVVTSVITPRGNNLICPRSSITLGGNAGGRWNTGEITSTISVSAPGDYQVMNTNTCGSTYSNIVHVDTIPSPIAPLIQFTTNNYFDGIAMEASTCPGTGLILSGNTNGVWNTGETTDSLKVSDTLVHYVITKNQCSSDTSVRAYLHFYKLPVISPITVAGPPYLCTGDSVLIFANDQTNYNWYYRYNYYGSNYLSYAGYGNRIYAFNTGNYFIMQNNSCGTLYSDSIHIEANMQRFDTAYIDVKGPAAFCEGDSVVLKSLYGNCTWSNGDTSQTIVVRTQGTYSVTNSNSCSIKISDPVIVTVWPAPAITFYQVPYLACIDADTIKISRATPLGGTYAGADIINDSLFYPPSAGTGVHLFTYTYTDSIGCSATAQQFIYVGPLPAKPIITQTGDTLKSDIASTYQWYLNNAIITGATNQSYVPQQEGSYSVAIANSLGCDSISDSFAYIATATNSNNMAGSENISVYPNPSPGNFTVIVPVGTRQVSVVDVLGRVLQIHDLYNSTATHFELHANGIYLVKISDGKDVVIKKITVFKAGR